MEATRVEIFREGLWRQLRLRDGQAIKYNALINRIGKIDSREISHTNTFSLPSVFQNTEALGINIFNKTELAKALNSKFPAKYYVEDKLLQQGFLVINNTADGDINVNFIDEALELTEMWGSTTFKELIDSTTITKPEDYRLSILQMTNYNMSKTQVLTPLTEVGTRGYNLAIFPNALNAIGGDFQKLASGERADNTFNPYQSRPIWNARAIFDLAVESFGYSPYYDSSINWSRITDTFIIDEGLDQNKVEDEGQVFLTYPAVGTQYAWRYTGRKGSGTKGTVFNFIGGSNSRVKRPMDIPNWVHPPSNYLNPRTSDTLSGGTDYMNQYTVLEPEIFSAAFGKITYKATVFKTNDDNQWSEAYACWENINHLSGGNVLFTIAQTTEQSFTNNSFETTIEKSQFSNPPYGSTGKLLGVLVIHLHRFHTRDDFFTKYGLRNIVTTENYLLADVISYDEYGQYIANSINLQHSAPNKSIKELLSGLMQKEGILLNINSKNKTVKFFSYAAYRTRRDAGDFYDWSDYFQEYISPQFNTDYGEAYAKKNEISLTDPYSGNTYNYTLENQGADSKYKEFKQSPVELFKDVEDIRKINNSIAPYYEYQNTGLGLVEKTNMLSGLNQTSADGIIQGAIPELQLVANVNYAVLPEGVREWYNLVDGAIRGNATLFLPVDIFHDLDLGKPVYIEGLGGYFIIEEIEEYVNARTPVVAKLIKLIEPTEDVPTPPRSTELIGGYNGSSSYSATLTRLTNDTNLVGSYSGSSTYSATLYYHFPDKQMSGGYLGSSSYVATLNKSTSLKQVEGSYSGSSSYVAQLIVEKKKFLLRTTDTFIGKLTIEGSIDLSSSIKIGDDLSVAGYLSERALRYRTTANGSYIDMCMKTGISTYDWINIVKNEW